MVLTDPILIIEDDYDDQLVLRSIFSDLKIVNELCFFSTTDQALAYLQTSGRQPFIILCSTGLVMGDGIGFKAFLEHHQHKLQGIPFIFLSTQVHSEFIKKAYGEISLQGIFIKPGQYERFRKVIGAIYEYWQYSLHPNQDRVQSFDH